MRKSVYIETSIPSCYYEVRTDPQSIARKNWTQTWWHVEKANYEVVTSALFRNFNVAITLKRPKNFHLSQKLMFCQYLKK